MLSGAVLSLVRSCVIRSIVPFDRYHDLAFGGNGASADFGSSSNNRCVEIPSTALFTNADRNIFKDHETALVPKDFAVKNPLPDGSAAMLAGDVVHGPRILFSRMITREPVIGYSFSGPMESSQHWASSRLHVRTRCLARWGGATGRAVCPRGFLRSGRAGCATTAGCRRLRLA